MRIGIINAGNIGSRLARAWAKAGHELLLAKDGESRKLEPLLRELGPAVRGGTMREAAAFGEVVLFSVYWPRLSAVLEEIGPALARKIVIETMNPLGVTKDFVHYHDVAFMKESSTSEELQRRLPEARVVKAFSTLPAPVLDAAAWTGSPVPPSVFYCTDDEEAGTTTRRLITDMGLRPTNAGKLASARQLEQLGILNHHVTENERGGDVAFGVALVDARALTT